MFAHHLYGHANGHNIQCILLPVSHKIITTLIFSLMFQGTTTLQVTILDVNDEAPQFLESEYFATITENSPVGVQVLPVSCTKSMHLC